MDMPMPTSSTGELAGADLPRRTWPATMRRDRRHEQRHRAAARRPPSCSCALGPERAAKIFSCLGEGEIESLSLEMTQIEHHRPRARATRSCSEVAETAMVASWAGTGGFDYAREVLEKAVGEERAAGDHGAAWRP